MLYCATASRSVMPEDDGLFILASYFNGIAHPPGYPLFTLLGHLFSKLPIESIAYRIHLTSAVCAAGACLALWSCLRALPSVSRSGALIGTLVFASSKTFWSQAIVAEVYTLNAALFLLVTTLALRYSSNLDRQSRTVGSLPFIAFAFGLGLANHWPLLVLSSAGLLFFFWNAHDRFIREFPLAVPLGLLGLAPYVWMIFRSRMSPEVSFYGPLESLDEVLYMIGRQGYAGVDQSESAQWMDKLQFLHFFAIQLKNQFTWLGAGICLLGFLAQWKLWPRTIALGLTVSFLSCSVLLILLLGFDYGAYTAAVFSVYPIPAYAVAAIWLGLGASVAGRALLENLSLATWHGSIVLALGGLFVLSVALAHAPANDRHLDDLAGRYARVTLLTLPPETNLLLGGDLYLGPIAYTHLIDGVRSDIRIYSPMGLIFRDRLFHPLRDAPQPRKASILHLMAESDRPVCAVGPGLSPTFQGEENWLFQCVAREQSGAENTFRLHPLHLAFLNQLVAEPVQNKPWAAALRDNLLHRSGELLAYMIHGRPEPTVRADIHAAYEAAMQTNYGRLGALAMIINHLDPTLSRLGHVVDDLLARIPATGYWYHSKREVALVHTLRGRVAQARGDELAAIRSFEHSLRLWLTPSNPAFDELGRYLNSDLHRHLDDKMAAWLVARD